MTMKAGFLDRLRAGLSRTRDVLNTPVEDLVRGRRLSTRRWNRSRRRCRGIRPPPGRSHGGAAPERRDRGAIEGMREALREIRASSVTAVVLFSGPWVVLVGERRCKTTTIAAGFL
jgi:hypothetical protein